MTCWDMFPHILTEHDRILAVVPEQEWPAASLRIKPNEDGRPFEHSVNAHKFFLVVVASHADVILTNVLNLEWRRPENCVLAACDGKVEETAHQFGGLPANATLSFGSRPARMNPRACRSPGCTVTSFVEPISRRRISFVRLFLTMKRGTRVMTFVSLYWR